MLRSINSKFIPQFSLNQYAAYNRKIDTIAKRGSMISFISQNRDKRKHWAPPDPSNVQKSKGMFEKVYEPTRRQTVLNKLFIQNVTDILSTGDIAPEIIGQGIEITGVKVAKDFKLVNIYWQIPPNKFDMADDMHVLLSKKAPIIRSELIGRNVLGRVPHIFFIRDVTNAKVAAFEECLKKADFGPNADIPIVTEEICGKDMYNFKSDRKFKTTENEKVGELQKQDTSKSLKKDIKVAPAKPNDMKLNIFGLDHSALMNKVMLCKKSINQTPQKTAVVNPYDGDLFSKIPGVNFQGSEDRDTLLKQFCLERKMLRNPKTKVEKFEDVPEEEEMTNFCMNDDIPADGDFIEEE